MIVAERIAEKLAQLTSIRTAIRTALTAKGVTDAGTHNYADFAEDIGSIQTGVTPTGTISITENGTYDVTEKSSAVVNVPNDVYYLDVVVASDGVDFTFDTGIPNLQKSDLLILKAVAENESEYSKINCAVGGSYTIGAGAITSTVVYIYTWLDGARHYWQAGASMTVVNGIVTFHCPKNDQPYKAGTKIKVVISVGELIYETL